MLKKRNDKWNNYPFTLIVSGTVAAAFALRDGQQGRLQAGIALLLVGGIWAWFETRKSKARSARTFPVTRGGVVSARPATIGEVSDLLDAGGLRAGSPDWDAAFAGAPVQLDGATLQLTKV